MWLESNLAKWCAQASSGLLDGVQICDAILYIQRGEKVFTPRARALVFEFIIDQLLKDPSIRIFELLNIVSEQPEHERYRSRILQLLPRYFSYSDDKYEGCRRYLIKIMKCTPRDVLFDFLESYFHEHICNREEPLCCEGFVSILLRVVFEFKEHPLWYVSTILQLLEQIKNERIQLLVVMQISAYLTMFLEHIDKIIPLVITNIYADDGELQFATNALVKKILSTMNESKLLPHLQLISETVEQNQEKIQDDVLYRISANLLYLSRKTVELHKRLANSFMQRCLRNTKDTQVFQRLLQIDYVFPLIDTVRLQPEIEYLRDVTRRLVRGYRGTNTTIELLVKTTEMYVGKNEDLLVELIQTIPKQEEVLWAISYFTHGKHGNVLVRPHIPHIIDYFDKVATYTWSEGLMNIAICIIDMIREDPDTMQGQVGKIVKLLQKRSASPYSRAVICVLSDVYHGAPEIAGQVYNFTSMFSRRLSSLVDVKFRWYIEFSARSLCNVAIRDPYSLVLHERNILAEYIVEVTSSRIQAPLNLRLWGRALSHLGYRCNDSTPMILRQAITLAKSTPLLECVSFIDISITTVKDEL